MNITYRHFVFFTYLVGTAIFKDYCSCEISSVSHKQMRHISVECHRVFLMTLMTIVAMI